MEKGSKTIVLTEGRISSMLIRFTLPFLLASFLQTLYGAVDLYVVGQFDSSAAVSAVAVGSQMMQTVTVFAVGLATGGTVLIGHALGRKDSSNAANAVAGMAIVFSVLCIILTPLLLIFCGDLAVLMQTPAEALEMAKEYLSVCACGVPFILGYNTMSGIFRGAGNSQAPLMFIAVACAINIGMDFLLVAGFDMGAKGAAVATISAQFSSFLISIIYAKVRGFGFAIARFLSETRFKLSEYSASVTYILRVGCPAALQNALVNLSFLAITAIMNTLGLSASAAVGLNEKLIGFTMLPPTAFAAAIAPITAQNIGAGKPERAVSALKLAILYSIIFGTACFIYAQFLPETLTALFSNDSEVIALAADYFRSYTIDCILVSIIFNMNAYFSGCGKSVVAFAHSMVATFIVRIPLSYAISRIPSVSFYFLGMAAPSASLLSVAICAWYFLRLRKRRPELSGYYKEAAQ